MLRSPKFLQSSPQFLHPPIPPSHPPQLQNIPTLTPFPIIKQCFKFSRRELAIGSSSSLLLLLGSQNLEPFFQSKALAEENIADTNINEGQEENSNLLFQLTASNFFFLKEFQFIAFTPNNISYYYGYLHYMSNKKTNYCF